MNIKKKITFLFVFIFSLFLAGCSGSNEKEPSKKQYPKGEYIYRVHHEYLLAPFKLTKKQPDPYPWDDQLVGNYPKITKEYFRCKGSSLNPVRTVQKEGRIERYFDCGGSDKHSLPLQEGKEFVYSILIDILNYIQAKTGKRVVVTSGHRCPEHNSYVDPSAENQYSKHMIAAEVSFYVQGMEGEGEKIVQMLQDYYKENPKYQGLKDYLEFNRYEKSDTNVSCQPWMNKEIFIKLFKKKEGRDYDNRHPYPYISIQVRYDMDKLERVNYSWDKANRNFLRK